MDCLVKESWLLKSCAAAVLAEFLPNLPIRAWFCRTGCMKSEPGGAGWTMGVKLVEPMFITVVCTAWLLAGGE